MKKTADITLAGNTYKLTSLDAKGLQEFLDWAKEKMPDPVDEVLDCAKKLPADYRDRFLDKNLDKAFERKRLRGSPADPDLDEFKKSHEAVVMLIYLILRPGHPNLSREDVFTLLLEEVQEKDFENIQKELAGLERTANHVPVSEEEAERRYFRDKGASSKKSKRRADKVDAS